MSEILTTGLLMGLIATLAMDAWAVLINRVMKLPAPNWGLPGRWVGHMPAGRLFHDDIAAADPVAGEHAIGWVFHYAVGIAYGVALALIMGPSWLAAPTFLPAFVFAIATISFGWFLMQPGMGAGLAASRTPTPWRARGLGLAAHTVFGVGLWAGAVI
ncbi:DUF2938 domain-containing protein [Roseobacter fucihabitans]|uniref:DUF2938 domain-containing protein n=1 Tax=Roseobacter fucihabitans TaxID=1537242 RepID=UPI00292A46F4|nr:DUF2938 domain-containing protein [Roseobacter litoralis]